MSRQTITKGDAANDSTGEGLRNGGIKIDANFAEVYVTIGTVATAGGTLTLSFLVSATVLGGSAHSAIKRIFIGDNSFAAAKALALANATESKEFDFYFQITNVAAVLTLPDIFIMADSRWDPSTPGSKTWTATEVGKYKMHAVFDGTNWWCEILGTFE